MALSTRHAPHGDRLAPTAASMWKRYAAFLRTPPERILSSDEYGHGKGK